MLKNRKHKIISFFAAGFLLILAMTACGKTEVTVYNMDETKTAESILENVKFEAELYQVKDNRISDFISSDECTKRIMFMGSGTKADSFGIFTVPDSESDYAVIGDEMLSRVQTYLTELSAAYRAYLPKESAKVDLAYTGHFGKYIVFCVTADYEKAQQVVEALVQSTVVEMDKKVLEAGIKPGDMATFTSFEPNVISDEYPPILSEGEFVDKGAVFSIGNSGYEAYTFTESAADKYINIINNAADLLTETANFYDVIIPLSSGIVLPDDYYDKVMSSNQQEAIRYIESGLGSNVNLVNPYDTLMKHRNEYIYYRTDHHWTQLGAYYAYEKLCEKMGVLPVNLERHKTERFPGFLGTFYSDMGFPADMKETPDDLEVYYPISSNVKMTYYTDDKSPHEWKIINDVSDYPSYVKYSAFIAGDNPYTVIENDDLQDGSAAVIVKESFGNCFVPFLVDHYQRLYVIDYRYWTGNLNELAKETKAEDVIFLNNLSMTRNNYLIGKISTLLVN